MRSSRAASALLLGGAFLAACRTAPPEPPPVALHAAWRGDAVAWARLNRVHVAPVDVSGVVTAPWFLEAERSGDVSHAEAGVLAAYAEERLRAAFLAEGFGLASASAPETLWVELAVTELLPAHDWLATLVSAPHAQSRGRIGVDVRWRVGEGGAPIATFSGASPGPALVVSGADFSWWGHARGPLDAWARELARLARAHAGGVPGRAVPPGSARRSRVRPRG